MCFQARTLQDLACCEFYCGVASIRDGFRGGVDQTRYFYVIFFDVYVKGLVTHQFLIHRVNSHFKVRNILVSLDCFGWGSVGQMKPMLEI